MPVGTPNLSETLFNFSLVQTALPVSCNKHTDTPHDLQSHVRGYTPAGNLIHKDQICMVLICIDDRFTFSQIQRRRTETVLLSVTETTFINAAVMICSASSGKHGFAVSSR